MNFASIDDLIVRRFLRSMEQGEEKKVSPIYKVIKWFVWLFYPKMEVVGTENLPDEPVVIVGNHT